MFIYISLPLLAGKCPAIFPTAPAQMSCSSGARSRSCRTSRGRESSTRRSRAGGARRAGRSSEQRKRSLGRGHGSVQRRSSPLRRVRSGTSSPTLAGTRKRRGGGGLLSAPCQTMKSRGNLARRFGVSLPFGDELDTRRHIKRHPGRHYFLIVPCTNSIKCPLLCCKGAPEQS